MVVCDLRNMFLLTSNEAVLDFSNHLKRAIHFHLEVGPVFVIAWPVVDKSELLSSDIEVNDLASV